MFLRGAMQPARQHRVSRDLGGVFGEGDERALRHVLGQVGITHHAHGGGMNQVHVAADQFGKGRFGAGLGPSAQQL